jgi:site-specific DNA recombinase
VSTRRQADEGYGLDMQKRGNREYIAQHWPKAEVDEFEDVITGKTVDRLDLDRLLAKLDQYDVVLVWKLDRFGRTMLGTLQLLADFDEVGTALASRSQQFDTTTPIGRGVVALLLGMAEEELVTISERTLGGAEEYRRSKAWGATPDGYTSAGVKSGRWTINPERAELRRRIFDEFVKGGKSRGEIARALNREGLRTKHGGKWTTMQVGRYLTSQDVLGRTKSGVQVADPIVDERLWNRAQKIITNERAISPRGAGRRPKHHLAGRGLLKCGLCGASMRARTPHRGQAFYECMTNVNDGAGACSMPRVPRVMVDDTLRSLMFTLHLDFEASKERLIERANEGAVHVRKALSSADRELAHMHAKRQRLDRDYDTGKINAALYQRRSSEYDAEEQAAQAEHERLSANLAAFREAPQTIGDAEFASGCRRSQTP